MLLTGILLTSGVVLLFVESVGYRRGGFDGAFWKLPLERQLDRISEKSWEWSWVAGWSVVAVFGVTGGLVSLALQLGDAGEPELAYVGLGIYLVAMATWMFGQAISYAGMSRAAKSQAETGSTPEWLSPFGAMGYVAEGTWILGSNVAYALLGAAILTSELLPGWAGWSAVGIGVAIVAIVLLAKAGFPQLSDLVPFVLGIAAILESI